MLIKPKKYSFDLFLNGDYDKDGKPVATKVCYVPKSIRVESNEKEVFKKEIDSIKETEVEKLKDDIIKSTSTASKEVIIEMYTLEKEKEYEDLAQSFILADGCSVDEYNKKISTKIQTLRDADRKKLSEKDDLKTEIEELANKRCNVYVISKAVTKTLLYTFYECIRKFENPIDKVFTNADQVEDLITEDDMEMLIKNWREFRKGFEEEDAKK